MKEKINNIRSILISFLAVLIGLAALGCGNESSDSDSDQIDYVAYFNEYSYTEDQTTEGRQQNNASEEDGSAPTSETQSDAEATPNTPPMWFPFRRQRPWPCRALVAVLKRTRLFFKQAWNRMDEFD